MDAQKKLEREVAEAEQKRNLVKDTLTVLDWQKQTREIARDQAKQRQEQERQMLKGQWEAELSREKKDAMERTILNLERNKELMAHNQQEKQLREQAELAEKQRDLQLLNASLAYEAALEKLEKEQRDAHRRETIELQKFALKEADDKAAYERMIDELVA